VEELEAAIAKVDPKKKIETGTFRLDGAGSQTKTLVSLNELFSALVAKPDFIFGSRIWIRI
jgi:hypothetical protein